MLNYEGTANRMDLSERKKKILRAVIESYIQNAEPVGSKTIVEHAGLGVSSATVRNEMADLEALGLLEQPHTSAGRIPSPKGYRLYVNELMEEHRLSLRETQHINDALRLKMAELDRVIDQAGRIVSQLTHYPAFALASGSSQVTIRRFDLLMVERNAFIVVVMTDTNVVRNKLFRLPSDLTEAQLGLLNTLLNTTFVGLTLDQITPELMRVASHAAGEAYGLISLVVSFAIEVLEELGSRSVHTAGIASLLSHPEYQSLELSLIHILSWPPPRISTSSAPLRKPWWRTPPPRPEPTRSGQIRKRFYNGGPLPRSPSFFRRTTMKFCIKHESRGRIRVQMSQPRMTLEQADLLEAYLQRLPQVRRATVHERTCCAII